MRLFWIAGLVASSFALPAQNPSPHPRVAVQYNPDLHVSSRKDLDQRIAAAFPEEMAHPQGVSNCAQLLAQRKPPSQRGASGPEIAAWQGTTVHCQVLRDLRGATPARVSYVHDLEWDEKVLPLLPPQLAISVSAESVRAANQAAGRGRNWLEFDPTIEASVKRPDDLVVTGKGFREELILWGRGDFNGDGIEDLLVQSLDTLTEGTYRGNRLFILTRRTPAARLSVVRPPL